MKYNKHIIIMLICLLMAAFMSCRYEAKKKYTKNNPKPSAKPKFIDTPIVFIQPLGEVKPDNIEVVKRGVIGFFGYKCVVRPKLELTKDLLAKSKTRYDAEKILAKFTTKDNLLIITQKDIASRNEELKDDEWGVCGLGQRPGKVCVISTFRLKNNVPVSKMHERLTKVALHEIGHNLGLEHCTSGTNCMMNAANGSVKEIDKERLWFCDKCRRKLKK